VGDLFTGLNVSCYLPNRREPLGRHALPQFWEKSWQSRAFVERSGHETLATVAGLTGFWAIIRPALRRDIAQPSVHLAPHGWDFTTLGRREI